MHIGSYDNEPTTIELMHKFANESGYKIDITDKRFHHEIYLSDPRRTKPERLKTVIRLPIEKYNTTKKRITLKSNNKALP